LAGVSKGLVEPGADGDRCGTGASPVTGERDPGLQAGRVDPAAGPHPHVREETDVPFPAGPILAG